MSQLEGMFQIVGKFQLKNNGGFVARMEFDYFDTKTNQWIRSKSTGDITLFRLKEVDPGDYGVPNNSLVRFHAGVVCGRGNEANEMFVYEKGNDYTANYVISGTTGSNSLLFKGRLPSPLMNGSVETQLEMFELEELTEEDFQVFEENFVSASIMQSGSLGPLTWSVHPNINHGNILKSSIDVIITLLGIDILNATLNASNPKATVNMKIKGINVSAELGTDFDKRIIYLKGSMQLGGHSKKFDFTILSF